VLAELISYATDFFKAIKELKGSLQRKIQHSGLNCAFTLKSFASPPLPRIVWQNI